ncbi:MAG TPA: iron ABC transporter permease [bacterium]|nr:iron ABC transporter permease [bacterium]
MAREAAFPSLAAARERVGARWILAAGGLAAAGLFGILVVYPSLVLVANAFLADGRPTLDHVLRTLRDPAAARTLWNSLLVSSSSAALGSALGAILAWLVTRTDLPAARFWDTVALLPYMIPPFIGAIAWVYLLGPVGYLNQAWMALTASPDPLLVIYGPGGIIFVLTLYGYPIAYATVRALLARMDPALEEAARIAGARPFDLLREITLPLVRPGLLAGALLLFMSSLANFGIPAVLGFPARYFVLPTKIYATILNFDAPFNLQTAAALSLWLVAVAAVALQAQRLLVRRMRFAVVAGRSAGGGAPRIALGRWRWLATAALGVFAFVAIVLPLGAILLTAITRAYGLPPTPDNVTLRHFATAFLGIPKAQRAFLNSLALSAGAATAIAVLALGLGYLIGRVRIRGAAVLDLLITIPYAVPGTVVALAMILAWLRPVPGLGLRLYNTIWIILLAYVARFLVFGVRTVLAGLSQVHESLEEAARISGARGWQAFRDIVLPIIRPSVAAGWFLVFIPAMVELTLSILLFSVGKETIGVVVFGLHEEGKIALSAAVAFVVTVLLVALHLLTRVAAVRELVR